MNTLEHWLTHLALAAAAQAWTELDNEAYKKRDPQLRARATFISVRYAAAAQELRAAGAWR